MALAEDLPRLWNHPAASVRDAQARAARCSWEIIVVVEPGCLRLKVHWKGGDHTALEVVKNRSGQHRWKTDAATEQLIRELARVLPDKSIASVLNRLGVRSAKGTPGPSSASAASATSTASPCIERASVSTAAS